MASQGEDGNGSEFMITLDNADILEGYNTVIGELVEGEDVLKTLEDGLARDGTFKEEFKIENCGTM